MTTQQPDALIPDEKTVMAQAQVYASTWAIVGSRFDAGDGLELAEQEKTILADMVRRLGARITELEAQLAQRFDAADMATASAQGFRDGVASVSAGSEPMATVFTMEALAPGGGVKYHATIHKPLPAGTKLYTHPSPPEGMAGWISVDEQLPEVGVTVLVYEPFRHGEDWPGTVRILFDYICPDYEDWHDHCASHEHFMAVGGANACGPDVTCTGPSEKAPYTHWMPLPPAPSSAQREVSQ